MICLLRTGSELLQISLLNINSFAEKTAGLAKFPCRRVSGTSLKKEKTMDLRQIENILNIAQEENITRAAEKLYISQPALNQQLLNLEKELGTRLFYRNRNNWKLTEAGEIYVEAGKRLLDIKKEAYARISDLAQTKREQLTIGVTPGTGGRMMAWVYKKFHRAYPEIRIQVSQAFGRQIQKDVGSGILDFGIMTIGESWTGKEVTEELRRAEMILVMSKDNPMRSEVITEADGTRTVDLSKFRDEYFILGSQAGINHTILTNLFEQAGFAPKLYSQSGGFLLNMSMVEENLCCSVIEEYHEKELPEGVISFKLTSHPILKVVAVHKPGKYLSRASRDFINMAKEYWKECE